MTKRKPVRLWLRAVAPALAVALLSGGATARPQEVDLNYDFEAGERVIVSEDYGGDNVGDFPRGLEFRSGNIGVVEADGRRALQLVGPCEFDVPLPEPLPEQFSIEFDLQLERHQKLFVGSPVGDFAIDNSKHPYHRFQVSPESDGTGILAGARLDAPKALTPGLRDFYQKVASIRIMVDGAHAKMYVDTTRVANLPRGSFGRGSQLRFLMKGGGKKIALIGPIRVAAGGRDLYEAIAAQGRVAVHAILFDTDAATIRPESADTLAGIAQMLKEHPDLRLMIEGHTDSTGDFDHNMDLSRRRAESVMQWLVERDGVDRGRLRTNGLGPTYPSDSNDTEAGRQQNRRVELVRID